MFYLQKYIHLTLSLVLIFFLSACSFFSTPAIKTEKSESLRVSMTNEQWSKIPEDSSDYAYLNRQSRSIIMVNSICNRYQDSSLNFLAQNLLSEIKSPKVIKREVIDFKGREALRQHAQGEMDGTKIDLITQTTKRNKCVFDFILIVTKDKHLNEDKADFLQFLDQIRFKEKNS